MNMVSSAVFFIVLSVFLYYFQVLGLNQLNESCRMLNNKKQQHFCKRQRIHSRYPINVVLMVVFPHIFSLDGENACSRLTTCCLVTPTLNIFTPTPSSHSTSFDSHVCWKLSFSSLPHNYTCILLKMYMFAPTMPSFFFSAVEKSYFSNSERVPFLMTSGFSPLLSVSLSPFFSFLFL